MKSPEFTELSVTSTLDSSIEKNLFFHPGTENKVPLLVGLHTWSFDRFNQINDMFPPCAERRWALLLPEFRGPNLKSNPRAGEACASEKARQDVVDAVNHVKNNYPIDADRIFLLGGSGGGHMALMMAAYAPSLWFAVSSWCPITDLAKWNSQNPHYAPHIEACCGGKPGDSDKVREEYEQRSPVTWTDKMENVRLYIHHGRFDASVPYGHTSVFAKEMEKRNPENFFFDIFDGTHELRHKKAFEWFDSLILKHEKNADNILTG